MQPNPDPAPVNIFTGKPLDPDAQRLNDDAMAVAFGSAELSQEAVQLIGKDAIEGFADSGLPMTPYTGESSFVRQAIAVINQLAGLPKSKAAADAVTKSLAGLDLPECPSREEINMVSALTHALTKWDEQPQALAGGGGVGSFFGGFVQGLESGSTLSRNMRDARDRRALKSELKTIANTTAEDAGTGLKVTGGGEVASNDPSTVTMMKDQEEFVRAFNGNTSPVTATPMVNFGGDLIKTDGPMDRDQVNQLRMNKMTGAALSQWGLGPQKFADGGSVGSFVNGFTRGMESGADLSRTMREGRERRDLNEELGAIASTQAEEAGTEEFSRAFNGTPAPAEEKPVDNSGGTRVQTNASLDGDQLRKLRLDKMMDAAMRHGDYDMASKLGQTRLNALKLEEAEQGVKEKRELRSALANFGAMPQSQYASRVAPKVVQTLLKQGNAAGAEAFQKFIDSQDGRRYTNRWDRIMRTYANGDFAGALPLITDLYNDGYPDGHRAKITPLGEGRYRFQHFNEAGEVIETGEGGAKELADLGVFTLSPEKRSELTFRSQADEAKARRQLDIEDRRQDRQDARLDRRLSAGKDGGALTVPQQRKNEEIKAARRQLSGMSKEELLRRTQSTTNTGRTNPDYDSQLVSLARLANSRMYGDDHDFDAFQNSTAKPAQATDQTKPAAATKPPAYNTTLKDQVDARRRFRDSPEVKDYALGKWVPGEGFEVLDNAGNHVGYYD